MIDHVAKKKRWIPSGTQHGQDAKNAIQPDIEKKQAVGQNRVAKRPSCQ